MKTTHRHLATGLAVVALSAPAAHASIPHEPGRQPSAGSAATGRPEPPLADLAGASPPAAAPVILRTGGGFDWRAAGTGFAAATAFALLGGGTLIAGRKRRHAGTPAP